MLIVYNNLWIYVLHNSIFDDGWDHLLTFLSKYNNRIWIRATISRIIQKTILCFIECLIVVVWTIHLCYYFNKLFSYLYKYNCEYKANINDFANCIENICNLINRKITKPQHRLGWSNERACKHVIILLSFYLLNLLF